MTFSNEATNIRIAINKRVLCNIEEYNTATLR